MFPAALVAPRQRQGQLALAVSVAALVSAAPPGWEETVYVRGLVLVWVTSPASVMVASALPTAPALRPSSLPILVGVNSWPARSASQAWTRARSSPGRSRGLLSLLVGSVASVVAASVSALAVSAA